MISQGLHGRNYDAFVSSQQSYNDDDVTSKIQEKYWHAKQKFLEKIKKKEDECIVLSDSKLDAKLEVLNSMDKSCEKLIDVLDMYQNCLYVLANDENSLGRFLRDCSKQDKTKAGKILETTGKAFTFSSHQRIQLYEPLLRFDHEIKTFHSRAVDDTNTTVEKLEKSRTEYRASLLWMKDISQKLDPDTFRQLEKFRKVQNQVKSTKGSFDKLQLDTFQKIDLLMASRCNLMNQILSAYQSSLLQTFEKNMKALANAEAVIQAIDVHEYEFKTLKELNSFRSPSLEDDQEQQQVPQSSGRKCDPCSEVKADESGDKELISDLLIDINSSDTRGPDKNLEDVVKSSHLLEDLFTNELTLLGDLSKMDDELSEFLSNNNSTAATSTQAQTSVQESSDLLADLGFDMDSSHNKEPTKLQDLLSENLIDVDVNANSLLGDLLDFDKDTMNGKLCSPDL